MTIRTRDVATSSATKRQLIPQRTEQLNIAFAFEDLASSLGRRGDWLKAAAHFEQARQVYLSNVDEDAPLVALGHARVGWAQLKAGQLDDARYNLEVASYLFDQELGTKHPYGAVVMMALGATHQQRGDHAEAAADVSRALERRRAMLASLGMPVAHLALPLESTIGVATQRYSILEDADGDWISDVIEASFGLDPNSLDSDADGLPDGEELLGSPGIAAGTVLGLTSDPLKILAHYGSRDPQLLGFEQWRPFVGVATNAESWKVEVDVQSFYYVRLTEAQKELAAERGFRTTAMFKHHVGGGFINVDLGKSLRRWDIAVSGTLNDSVEIMANDSVAPALGRTFTYRSILSPVVQLIYDPLTSTAKLLANGRTQIDGYRGHMQFQEGHGFFFGAWNQIGIAPRGEIDYSLAMFEIR